MSLLKSLECPICLEYMIAEISLCESGHSVCQKCKDQLNPARCPTCRRGFTTGRNYALEDIASTTPFPCKYKGCDVQLQGKDMKNHLLKCDFRTETCILSFDKCTWKGTRKEIREHILDVHST